MLPKARDDADVLSELNRALLHGRIWRQEQYGLLSEVVAHGRTILRSRQDDPAVYRRVCDTLLYIPDMPEAVEFIKGWMCCRRVKCYHRGNPGLEPTHREIRRTTPTIARWPSLLESPCGRRCCIQR